MTEKNEDQIAEKANIIGKGVIKILDFLRLTSGTSLIIVDEFWFIYGLTRYIMSAFNPRIGFCQK